MKNKHRVPKKQWKKWPEVAQRVFNEVYEGMDLNPAIFTDPKTRKLAKEQQSTVSWNAAWIAADACVNSLNKMASGK